MDAQAYVINMTFQSKINKEDAAFVRNDLFTLIYFYFDKRINQL